MDYDLTGKSMKAQMRYADKQGAAYTIALGDNELAGNRAVMKNMKTKEQSEISLGDNLIGDVYSCVRKSAVSELTRSIEFQTNL